MRKLILSYRGLRVGRLYDNANGDDKELIDLILRKYSSRFPFLRAGTADSKETYEVFRHTDCKSGHD